MNNIFYPLEILAKWFTLEILKMTPQSRLAESVTFFIYDSVKIIILLIVIIFIISIVRTYLSPKKIKAILSYKHEYIGNVLAAVLGIFSCFCTCSAIPLFLGFVEAGVPLGVTFSFLIASPMINEIAVVMLLGMFGLKIALIYIVSGLFISVFSGIIIGRLHLGEYLIKLTDRGSLIDELSGIKKFKDRLKYAMGYTLDIVSSIWPYILIGIGIGAIMHGYVPADRLAEWAGADKWYGVIIAALIGIPLYSNSAGIIPLVGVLTEKGVATGTALAFMMAVIGLSLPEFLILKKVMRIKLLVIFISIVGLGIIFTGYLFNILI